MAAPNNVVINVAPARLNATVPPAAIVNSGKVLANAVKSANEISRGLNTVAGKLTAAHEALTKNELGIANAAVNVLHGDPHPFAAAAAEAAQHRGEEDPATPGHAGNAAGNAGRGNAAGNAGRGNAAGNAAGNAGRGNAAGNAGLAPLGIRARRANSENGLIPNNLRVTPGSNGTPNSLGGLSPSPIAHANAPHANGNLVNVNLSASPRPAFNPNAPALGLGSVIGGSRSALMTRTRKAIRTVAKMIGGFRQTVTNAALALDNGVKAANSLATAAKKNATVTNMKAANAALNATTPLVNNASKAANSVLKRNVVPPVKVVANNGAAQVKAVNTAANHVLNATKSNYNFLSGGRRMTRRRR